MESSVDFIIVNTTELLQSRTAFCCYKIERVVLLQSGTVLLLSETGITKWDNVITKWDGYYNVNQ